MIAQSTLLKYDNRLPYRRVADILERQYGLTITPASVLDLTRRASDKLRIDYKEIRNKIRNAKMMYIDETSIDVGGRKFWIWIFVTSKYTFVVIRKIIGTLRNDKGTRIHETIMTMFATWKQQG